MKTFYTSRDIEDMVAKGAKELLVTGEVTLTDEAEDRAVRLGLELRRNGNPKTAPAAPVAADGISPQDISEIIREVMACCGAKAGTRPSGGLPATSRRRLLIGGRWTDSASGKFFAVTNPATNQVIAEVAEGGAEDVSAAVAAAHRAFEEGPWGKMSAVERGRCLSRVAQLLREKAEQLALLETTNAGKPISQTRAIDLPAAADTFEYYAGAADKVEGQTMPLPGNFLNYTLREPLGVVGIIVPWNFPLMIASWKLAPALAAGNAVVLKPASLTPLSALELGAICQEAGIPEGVVNVVPGPGSTVGDALVQHPGVAKIAFTGETATGRGIARCGAETIKRITLELGGKSPNIVFDDADIDRAVSGSLFAIYLNAGEVCAAGSRLFLHERIHDAFLERFVSRAKAIRVGDTMCEQTQMGPLISRQHLEKVKGYVRSGIDQGARLVSGGTPPPSPECSQGNYFLPTIFDGVTMNMKIAQEEIFGPVVAVLTFRDEDEVVKQANSLIYGLAAGVWTRDITRGHRVASRIKSGSIWINAYNLVPVEAPFGGYKQSGIGRDLGLEAMSSYLQTKNVCVDLSSEGIDWFKG
ncbi:MAG: aldehyde dehydrogenase [Chloroflexi bacterium]|nr:aldehyde dehydrogenase [Chloroflexota bacterium]MCL5959867.1 aldehyde dehydrogenase [Chloroflexota bacterium]